jgi:ADP-heptose:LPS heptosyltransferase
MALSKGSRIGTLPDISGFQVVADSIWRNGVGERYFKHKHEPISKVIEQRKRILIKRQFGGLGDILMMRPIFHEIKRIKNSSEITFALPKAYFDAVMDVDGIYRIIDFEEYKKYEFSWIRDISTACVKHEIGYGPNVFIHRTNIWANHLGLGNIPIETFFTFTKDELERARRRVEALCGNKEVIIIAPCSADPLRTIRDEIIVEAGSFCRDNGFAPLLIHSKPLDHLGIPCVHGVSIRDWMALFTTASAVLTTDTSSLHMAALMGVRTCATFHFTSSKVICQPYPTVIPVQLHRDDDGLPCCPCYKPSACPHVNSTIKCSEDMTKEMALQGLERALKIEEKPRRWAEGVLEDKQFFVKPDVKEESLDSNNKFYIDVHNPSFSFLGIVIAQAVMALNKNSYIYTNSNELCEFFSKIKVSKYSPDMLFISTSKPIEMGSIEKFFSNVIGTDFKIMGVNLGIENVDYFNDSIGDEDIYGNAKERYEIIFKSKRITTSKIEHAFIAKAMNKEVVYMDRLIENIDDIVLLMQ